MRVLHLTTELPPVVHGGLGRYVHGLARAQAAAGDDVTVIAPDVDLLASAGSPTAPAHELLDGVRVVRVPVTRPATGLDDFLAAAQALADELLRAAAAQHADVVHGHDWMTAGSARVAADRLHVPMVLTLHATESGRRAGRLDTALARAIDAAERDAVASADRVVVCSSAMVGEAAVLGRRPGEVVVVPGGVDAAAWVVPADRVARARRRLAPDRPLVVAAGRLEWEKGFSTLLRAVPGLSAAVGPVRVALAGRGSYRPTLQALAVETGADVTFTGRLGRPDLAALLAAADAVVVPSRYEPFGLIALEAQAAGAPVVATRVGGLADLVRDGRTGRQVEPGDVDRLAVVLAELVASPERARRLAATGQRAAAARTWSAVADALRPVYRGPRFG